MKPTRPFFTTICVAFIQSSTIFTQPLYDNDYLNYNDFNSRSREIILQTLLEQTEIHLEEVKPHFEKCRARQAFSLESYNKLLEMMNKGEIPNDKTIDTICASQPKLIIKSQTECHRYYNCSGEDPELTQWKPIYKLWPAKYKHECHYPFLFSEETLQCENYTNVKCGSRTEAPWECDYFRLWCKSGPCKPCSMEYPSCKNKTDGVWPWPSYFPYFPDYMKCEKSRRIEKGYCPIDSLWGVQSFPYDGQCVQLFAVPHDLHPNGQLPSCKDKQDGNYQFLAKYCYGFYECANGEAFAVKCPQNTTFDTANKTCSVNGTCIY